MSSVRTSEMMQAAAPPRRPRVVVGLVIAIMVAVVAVGLWVVSGDRGTESESEPEFDFATDSLCDWFSAEDMNRIVAAAQEQAGTAWPFAAFETSDCSPYPVDREPGTAVEWLPSAWVTARTQPTRSGGGLAIGLMPVAWVPADWGNWSRGEPVADFVGHGMLDESVTYGGLVYWSDWLENMRVDLRVEGHENEVLRFVLRHSNPGPVVDPEDREAQVALGLAVADAMLRQMNWVD